MTRSSLCLLVLTLWILLWVPAEAVLSTAEAGDVLWSSESIAPAHAFLPSSVGRGVSNPSELVCTTLPDSTWAYEHVPVVVLPADHWDRVTSIVQPLVPEHVQIPFVRPADISSLNASLAQQFDMQPVSSAYVAAAYIGKGINTEATDAVASIMKSGRFSTADGYYDEMGLHVVPEPSSLVALSGGALALGGVVRRRMRR